MGAGGGAPRLGTAAWALARLAWRDRATASARALIARRTASPLLAQRLLPGLHPARAPAEGSFHEPWPPGRVPLSLPVRHVLDRACDPEDCAYVARAASASLGVLRQRDGEASVAALGDVASTILGEEAHCVVRRLVGEMTKAASDAARTELHPAGGLLTLIVPGDVDEAKHGYWSPHVDKANVPEYDVSAVLYLSDGDGADFDGGELRFLDEDEDGGGDVGDGGDGGDVGDGGDGGDVGDGGDGGDSADGGVPVPARRGRVTRRALVPARGRLVVFGSGEENVHEVTRVVAGERVTLNLWLTGDERAASPLH